MKVEIELGSANDVVVSGRLDAVNADEMQRFMDAAPERTIVDCRDLDYISSAGLGVLLKVHKRLMSGGGGLILTNVNPHINEIFHFSGFDKLFTIEVSEA